MTKDPVCEHEVDEQRAWEQGLAREFEGRTFYFCGKACMEQFMMFPAIYMGAMPELNNNNDWWKQGGDRN